jgi:hypothetical protein
MIMAIMAMAKQPSSLKELEDIIELVCLFAILFVSSFIKTVLNVMRGRHFANRLCDFFHFWTGDRHFLPPATVF